MDKFIRGVFLRVNHGVKKEDALKEAWKVAKEENREVLLLFHGKTHVIKPTDSEVHVRASNKL